jgi:hypothetical protein
MKLRTRVQALFEEWEPYPLPTTQWMMMGMGDASAGAPPGGNFLVQESDGTSKFTLENGTGSILLEN